MIANDLAFPVLDRDQTPNGTFQLGLTKREWFAGQMMQTVMQGASATPELFDEMLKLASALAVKAADALLAELAKPQTGEA